MKTIKVRIRPDGPITEQPEKQARKLISEGLWFDADEKAAEVPTRTQKGRLAVEKKADSKPDAAELTTTRKTR